ncbi:hypothetical protein [Thalassoglobus sp.]|uniref:hypothetical protein n=1 Tax=Thalassoglobus sp. TaxID=2795869 RepID=UPI003AA86BAE
MQELTVTTKVHFTRGRKTKKEFQDGAAPNGTVPPRLPRVTKLMALAIRFEGLVRNGTVANFAELARLGHVSRARISQIMNLLMLAPDIQEEILHLSRATSGRDSIHLRQLQPIAWVPDWRKQRKLWKGCVQATNEN